MSSPPRLSNFTNYETVTGKRKGSVLYRSNSFLYRRKVIRPETIHLVCQLHKSGCTASASIKTSTNILTEIKPHNHGPAEHDYELMVFKTKLKEEASKSSASNREVFDSISREYPQEISSRVSYPMVERQMSRRKLELFPRVPRSPSEFALLLDENNVFSTHLQSNIFEGDELISTIFFSRDTIENIQSFANVCFDGTFFIVPRIFSQLFVISVKIGNRFIPVFFGLMTSKLHRHYLLVLMKIKELVPGFLPVLAIGDFERACVRAWKDCFPGINIQGCLFHFKQAIMRKLAKLNLKTLYLKNPSANCFFNLLMGLGFLPQDRIVPTFHILSTAHFSTDSQMEKINRFLIYFQRTWLLDTTRINWFDAEVLTNNFSESFNKQLKMKFKVHHSNPWVFLEKLNTIINDMNLEILRIGHCLATTRQRHPDTLKTVAENLKNRISNGELSSTQFLIEHLRISEDTFQSLNIRLE